MEYNFQTCRDNRWEKSDSTSKELAVQSKDLHSKLLHKVFLKIIAL